MVVEAGIVFAFNVIVLAQQFREIALGYDIGLRKPVNSLGHLEQYASAAVSKCVESVFCTDIFGDAFKGHADVFGPIKVVVQKKSNLTMERAATWEDLSPV